MSKNRGLSRIIGSLPEDSPMTSAIRRALARAHRPDRVDFALMFSIAVIRFDTVVEIPGIGLMDCTQPDEELKADFDAAMAPLNDHDRGVVAGFIAELEGMAASSIPEAAS